MNTITSTPAATSTSTAATNSSTAVSENKESTTPSTTEQAASNFTSRAEKLATLNKEFNIVSPDFRINQAFVNRMAELELISSQDAEKLNAGIPATASGDKQTDTVAEIETFIDTFSTKLKNAEEQPEDLMDILQDSKSILANLDGSKSKTFEADIATTNAALTQFLKSDDAKALTESERGSLSDLQTALTVADKLNPTSRTSENINAYMRVLGNLS